MLSAEIPLRPRVGSAETTPTQLEFRHPPRAPLLANSPQPANSPQRAAHPAHFSAQMISLEGFTMGFPDSQLQCSPNASRNTRRSYSDVGAAAAVFRKGC